VQTWTEAALVAQVKPMLHTSILGWKDRMSLLYTATSGIPMQHSHLLVSQANNRPELMPSCTHGHFPVSLCQHHEVDEH